MLARKRGRRRALLGADGDDDGQTPVEGEEATKADRLVNLTLANSVARTLRTTFAAGDTAAPPAARGGIASFFGRILDRYRNKASDVSHHRIRLKADNKLVAVPRLSDKHGYHLYLSYVLGSGQDQMRVIKQRLLEMLPGVSIFLDVDDLTSSAEDIGDVEGYVDRSAAVLVFCSPGYFESKNCMRELRCAVSKGKPLIALLEEPARGGASVGELRAQLAGSDMSYVSWGFDGDGGPRSESLAAALFKKAPFEWNRTGFFQNVTLRLIAEQLLPHDEEEQAKASKKEAMKPLVLEGGRSGDLKVRSGDMSSFFEGDMKKDAAVDEGEAQQEMPPYYKRNLYRRERKSLTRGAREGKAAFSAFFASLGRGRLLERRADPGGTLSLSEGVGLQLEEEKAQAKARQLEKEKAEKAELIKKEAERPQRELRARQDGTWCAGMLARIHGFRGRVDLNGKIVTLGEWNEARMRWSARVNDTGEQIWVEQRRLELLKLSAEGGVHDDPRVYTIVELTGQPGFEAGKPLPPYVFDMSESTGLRSLEKYPEIAEMADELIGIFATDEKPRIQAAQSFRLPADLKNIIMHAHTLGGVASNLHQKELESACKLLEKAGLDLEKPENAPRLADATVQEEIAHLLAVIDARVMMIVNWSEAHGRS